MEDDAPLVDPMIYFQNYLGSFVRIKHSFVFLRQPVTRVSQLQNPRPVPVYYDPQEASVIVKDESTSEKKFPVANFEKFDIQTIDSPTGKLSYIFIGIKDEKRPVILYGPTNQVEIWFDGIRLELHQTAMTASSQDRIGVFQQAVNYSSVAKRVPVPIPPPPQDPNYPPSI